MGHVALERCGFAHIPIVSVECGCVEFVENCVLSFRVELQKLSKHKEKRKLNFNTSP